MTVKPKNIPILKNIIGNDGVILVIITAIVVIITVPLFVVGDAKKFSGFVKYRNIALHTCYGGQNLSDYQVTPSFYNSSLTYWPAQLHVSTIVKMDNDTFIPVTLIYPTLFETKFDCYCSDTHGVKCPCQKMVGDVIIKYNELRVMNTFDCYINHDDNTIIGLAGEQSIIKYHFRLSVAAIVIMVMYAFYCMLCIAIIYSPILINYIKDKYIKIKNIPIDDNKCVVIGI